LRYRLFSSRGPLGAALELLAFLLILRAAGFVRIGEDKAAGAQANVRNLRERWSWAAFVSGIALAATVIGVGVGVFAWRFPVRVSLNGNDAAVEETKAKSVMLEPTMIGRNEGVSFWGEQAMIACDFSSAWLWCDVSVGYQRATVSTSVPGQVDFEVAGNRLALNALSADYEQGTATISIGLLSESLQPTPTP